ARSGKKYPEVDWRICGLQNWRRSGGSCICPRRTPAGRLPPRRNGYFKPMPRSDVERLVIAATVSAGAMIAFQVAGKATRRALFLSSFPVTALPAMLAASAMVSIAAVLVIARLISAKGPRSVIPAAYGASSILLVAEWLVYSAAPKTTTTVFYLHMAGFGAIL